MAENESAEAEFQQKLSGILSEKIQLNVSLQKKQGECVLDEALCEKHAGNQRLGTQCR